MGGGNSAGIKWVVCTLGVPLKQTIHSINFCGYDLHPYPNVRPQELCGLAVGSGGFHNMIVQILKEVDPLNFSWKQVRVGVVYNSVSKTTGNLVGGGNCMICALHGSGNILFHSILWLNSSCQK